MGGEGKSDKTRPNSNIFFLTAGFAIKLGYLRGKGLPAYTHARTCSNLCTPRTPLVGSLRMRFVHATLWGSSFKFKTKLSVLNRPLNRGVGVREVFPGVYKHCNTGISRHLKALQYIQQFVGMMIRYSI